MYQRLVDILDYSVVFKHIANSMCESVIIYIDVGRYFESPLLTRLAFSQLQSGIGHELCPIPSQPCGIRRRHEPHT